MHTTKTCNSTVNWWFVNEPTMLIRCVSFFSVTGKIKVGKNLYLPWHWSRKSHICASECVWVWVSVSFMSRIDDDVQKKDTHTHTHAATNKSETNKCICKTWLRRIHHRLVWCAGCYSQHECAFHRSFHSLRAMYSMYTKHKNKMAKKCVKIHIHTTCFVCHFSLSPSGSFFSPSYMFRGVSRFFPPLFFFLPSSISSHVLAKVSIL